MIKDSLPRTGKKWMLIMQALNILFSLSGAMVKMASMQMQTHGLLSYQTLFFIVLFGTMMMIYAFFWQKVVAYLPLSTAYLGKSLTIFWSQIWAYFLFGESVGLWNIIGAMVVFLGTVLVMRDE